MTAPDTSNTVEAKVWASTGAAAAASAVVVVLNAVQDHPDLIAGLPVWAQSTILLIVPTAATWLAGWLKKSNRV